VLKTSKAKLVWIDMKQPDGGKVLGHERQKEMRC